jgi:hypothetical protein
MRSEIHAHRSYWQSFYKRYFNKKGAVSEVRFGSIYDRQEVFEGLVHLCDSYKTGNTGALVSMQLNSKFDPLPRKADRNWKKYLQRVENNPYQSDVFISFHNLEEVSADLWLKTRDFGYGLRAQVGRVPDSSDLAAFISNVDFTPFGVHTDIFHNFTFMIEGIKNYRIWPRKTLDHLFPGMGRRARPINKHYGTFLKGSQLLKGRPDTITYWPDSFWHVGEGLQQMTSTVVAGFEYRKKSMPIKRTRGEELLHESAFGFRSPIPLRKAVRLPSGLALHDHRIPPLILKMRDGMTIYYNGHQMELPRTPGLERFVELIALGHCESVRDLLAPLAPKDLRVAKTVLTNLLRGSVLRPA